MFNMATLWVFSERINGDQNLQIGVTNKIGIAVGNAFWIPEGKMASGENNWHIKLNRVWVEYLYQTESGDCTLVCLLNTFSMENIWKIPMSVTELRNIAIDLRMLHNENYTDILNSNSPLTMIDYYRLSLVLFSDWKFEPDIEQDYVPVDGNMTRDEMINNIQWLLSMFELGKERYQSSWCLLWLAWHAMYLKRLENNNYMLLDPMNSNWWTIYSESEIASKIADFTLGKSKDANFFFFLSR